MAWVYLIAAGLFEVGWPVGLKWAQLPDKIIVGIIVAIVCMAVSGCLLFLAQKEIALGTAYAVWTGIGAPARSCSASGSSATRQTSFAIWVSGLSSLA
jgi:quaternary ammonium compound-resistance protein SugE